ncbi:MAG: hypothetical protein KME29_31710 [Calothrix sp. FI2-JRJ7]|nr:hypothetical protein [Calothrix sp. FI2-JRJ7]
MGTLELIKSIVDYMDEYSTLIVLILVFDYAETHAIYVEYSAIVMRRCKAQQGFQLIGNTIIEHRYARINSKTYRLI